MGERKKKFMKFLWNKETKEVLGRTGMSWLKIFIFYVIFYLALAAFWLLMLYIFFLTIDTNVPKYEGDSSLLGENPGMGFRPRPDQNKNVEFSLIWFQKANNANGRKERKFLTDQLKKITKEAEKHAKDPTSIDCTKNNRDGKTRRKLIEEGHACRVPVDAKALGPCTAKNDFGYKFGSPCVLIKLNKIYGWKPKTWTLKKTGKSATIDTYREMIKGRLKKDLGDNKIPYLLFTYIKDFWKVHNKHTRMLEAAMSGVWIHCEGETAVDRENIGHLEYFPSRSIPGYYFPYKRQKAYQSPFVMVHFESITPGVLVNVECRAYAANIEEDRTERTGSVHFELLVD